jgi:regulator of protease activity HflC (stomatin/prohibitin superfamily)
MILRANAKKESMIAEAEGQAQAMERVFLAQAKGVEMINQADPNTAFLTLKGYEALQSLANGQSTKIIVPSNLQDIAGTLTSISEVLKDSKK